MSDISAELRRKLLDAAFKMPACQTMKSRKSSVTNAFVNAVIPAIPPSVEEIAEALKILKIDPADMRCAYCGDAKTEWDHLRPLVLNHRPTGYISEIGNLVPACGKCNQSKGNKNWRTWMLSTATRSPTSRKIADVKKRVANLKRYEQWRPPTVIDFEGILGAEDWNQYWSLWETLVVEMRRCAEIAELIQKRIIEALKPQGEPAHATRNDLTVGAIKASRRKKAPRFRR